MWVIGRPHSIVRYTPSRRAAVRHRFTVRTDRPVTSAMLSAETMICVPSRFAAPASARAHTRNVAGATLPPPMPWRHSGRVWIANGSATSTKCCGLHHFGSGPYLERDTSTEDSPAGRRGPRSRPGGRCADRCRWRRCPVKSWRRSAAAAVTTPRRTRTSADQRRPSSAAQDEADHAGDGARPAPLWSWRPTRHPQRVGARTPGTLVGNGIAGTARRRRARAPRCRTTPRPGRDTPA